MEKRLYAKPLMSVEQFTPGEYVAACWAIKEGACFSTLYHDDKDWRGRYNGEHENSESNLVSSNHTSHGRRVFNVEKSGNYETVNNDGHYYVSYSTEVHSILGVPIYYTYPYNIPAVSGPIYKMTDRNGVTHYFNDKEDAGNHS